MIEKYFVQYPDVSPSIILKTEALRIGVKFSERAKEEAKNLNTVFKGYHLFSYDRTRTITWEEKIPADFFLRKDDTFIQTRVNEDSSYTIDFLEGKFVFREESEPIEEVYFRTAPEYYSKTLDDGTPMRAIVQSINDMLFVTINKYCELWKTNDQCLFCDFVTQTSEQKQKEVTIVHKTPEQICQVLGEAFKEWRHRHLLITGGTILTTYKGKNEIDYYCEHLNAIAQTLKVWYPANFQINAKNREEFKKIYDTGIGCIQPNLEVWDRRLFKILCPGKDKFVGYDEWIRRMIEAVEVFGFARVAPNFVSGIEMAKPWGFQDIKSALESTLVGFDFLMKHGILPRLDMWTTEPNSALADQAPPPLEYYIELGKGYMELRHKHGMPTPIGHCRGCYRIDTTFDWEYFHGQ